MLPEQQPCCDLLLEQHLQHLLPALYYRCIITDPQQMALNIREVHKPAWCAQP